MVPDSSVYSWSSIVNGVIVCYYFLPLYIDGCSTVATGATIGGFIGGVLLSAAIAGVIAVVVLCRAKRRGIAKLEWVLGIVLYCAYKKTSSAHSTDEIISAELLHLEFAQVYCKCMLFRKFLVLTCMCNLTIAEWAFRHLRYVSMSAAVQVMLCMRTQSSSCKTTHHMGQQSPPLRG